jgi:hypothetical protein
LLQALTQEGTRFVASIVQNEAFNQPCEQIRFLPKISIMRGELNRPLEVLDETWPVGTVLRNVEFEGEKGWCGELPDGKRIEIRSEAFMVLDKDD